MLRVVVVGLGAIGCACSRAVQMQGGMELVGLFDTDPCKVARTLGQIDGRGGNGPDAGPVVTDRIDTATLHDAHAAVVCTTSSFKTIAPTIRQLLVHKVAVVSSCEQMLWPWYREADLAESIHRDATAAGRAVLGTGVNPGFVMDSLTVVLASAVQRVTSVRCVRRVDAATRRNPLQRKIGATMAVDEFKTLARTGKIGHQGLAESVALLAAGLGRRVESGTVAETLDPVIAEQPIESALGSIEPGRVAGMHNTARWRGDELSIELDLTMAVGLSDPIDTIELDGPVPLRLALRGGVPGDSATIAMLINHLPVVHRAGPGLLTMLDLPPAGCHGRDT
ncbi:MAG: hypothetical protein V3U29_01170 [Phycisphaeraceae bacterium]